MRYLIYSEDNNNLVYDNADNSLYWSKNKPGIDADRKVLQTLLNHRINLKTPNNIQIKSINSDKLTIFDNKLKTDTVLLGEISFDIKKHEIESLKKNGGAVLIYLSEIDDLVIKVIPKYISGVKSEPRIYSSENNVNNEYIEAVLKIPKFPIVENETLNRILDSNILIYKKVNEITSKMDYIKNFTNDVLNYREIEIEKEKEREQLLSRLNELEKNNDMLLRERALFEKEIKNAEKNALLKIKNELKVSIAAINRIVDLDEFDLKKRLFEVAEQMQAPSGNKKSQMKKSDNKAEVFEIIDFTDNLEVKIQSLKEIKQDFSKLNLLED